jgi:hypothetical protein
MRHAHSWLLLLLTIPLLISATPAAPVTVVACAPGYPGTTAEAQKAMDSFATVLAQAAHWSDGSVGAVYFPAETDGLARLSKPDAAVALVPFPLFLAQRAALDLKPRLSVEMAGVGLTEQWTLVAKKGRVKAPADLATMTVASIAGYAPDFVRGALGGWGRIPDSAKIVASAQVLSVLRKAATAGDTAVLLDGAQAASLSSLPFAKDLEVVTRSVPMPSALVATVGSRMPEKRWADLEKALLALSSNPKGVEALSTIRMLRFVPLDSAALSAAGGEAPKPVAGAGKAGNGSKPSAGAGKHSASAAKPVK